MMVLLIDLGEEDEVEKEAKPGVRDPTTAPDEDLTSPNVKKQKQKQSEPLSTDCYSQ